MGEENTVLYLFQGKYQTSDKQNRATYYTTFENLIKSTLTKS